MTKIIFTSVFFLLLGCSVPKGTKGVIVKPDDVTQEGDEPVTPEVLRNAQRVLDKNFTEPNYTTEQKTKILEKYNYLDSKHEVNTGLLAKALYYYEWNYNKIDNQQYLSVLDFAQNSIKSRFFIINISTGKVWSLKVAHGEGSDPDNDGLAQNFSNTVDSHMSSLGFYYTAEVYNGQWGRSMRMDGLSTTNNNVRKRAIVIHGADYVVDEENTQPGRSWGCFAFSLENKDTLITQLQGGSLIYAGLGK